MNKRIEENTVRYCLYPKVSTEEAEHDSYYRRYIDDCLAKLANYLTDYYWYYTPFNLTYINKESSHSKGKYTHLKCVTLFVARAMCVCRLRLSVSSFRTVAHVEGCTNFDENIEDEWFIVYLLFELSNGDPDLVIQVEDSDGYFLLIEAADHLPKWVNPKTSVNRCFIYRGELHLIPINQSAIKPPTNQSKHQSIKHEFASMKPPTVQQALNVVREQRMQTVCSTTVQEQIKRRIADYPTKIYSTIHKSNVILPCSVAFLLNENPTLISHAIRAFYCRDDLDLAACRLMKHFQPKQLVKRAVKLSRFNYAQLVGQNYKPDSKLNWYAATRLSANDDRKATGSGSSAQIEKQYDLGFKISCGFEILVSTYTKTADCESSSRRTTQQNWKSFLNNLKRSNYFDNLIEQSTDYNVRLEKARLYFENSVLAELTSDGALIEHSQIGRRICDLLDKFNCNEASVCKRLKEEELNLSDEDSDRWLSEVPECLLNSEKERDNNSFDDLPSEITNCLQEFIKSDSDYKGIELDNNPKKRKSDLKERAFKMMSDNLRSIITMKVSDSESDHTETDLSDYNYSSASSADEAELNVNELKYMKQSVNKSRKFKDRLNERKKRTKVESSNGEIEQLMNEMDKELAATTIGKSFEKLSVAAHKNVPMASCAEFDEDYSDEDTGLNEVDVEYNAVKNLLGSFKEQNGLSGPTSTILNQLGVRLPKDLD